MKDRLLTAAMFSGMGTPVRRIPAEIEDEVVEPELDDLGEWESGAEPTATMELSP